MKERVKKEMNAKSYRDQQGSAKVYAIAAVTVIFLMIHAGWNFFPVLYQCESFKSELKNSVLQVQSLPRRPDESVTDKLKKRLRMVANDNGVPANANIEVSDNSSGLRARVRFIREVNILPFGLYKYQYNFDESGS
jgi:hypothetical protein